MKNEDLDMMPDPGIDTEKRNAELDADLLKDRKSTRLNSSHRSLSLMPSSA